MDAPLWKSSAAGKTRLDSWELSAPNGKRIIIAPDLAVMLVGMLSGFVDAFSYSFLVSLAPNALQTQFGIKQDDLSAHVARLYSTFSIGALCGNCMLGTCAARNSQATFLVSAMVLSGSAIWFAYATSITGMLFARAVQGLASAGNWTACLAMLAEHFSPEELGPAVGNVFMFNSVGSLVGPFIGGVIYDYTSGVKWPALTLALLAGIDLLVRCCITPGSEDHTRQPVKLSVWPLLTYPRIVCICACVFAGALCQGYFRPIVSTMLHDEHFSSTSIGYAFMAMAVGSALGAKVCGALSKQWQSQSHGHARLVLMGQVMVAASSIGIAVPCHVPRGRYFKLEMIACSALGASCAFFITPNVTRLSDEVKAFYVNAAPAFGFLFSIFNFSFTLGDLVGPLVGGVIDAEYGVPAACCVLSLSAVLSMALAVLGEMQEKRTLAFSDPLIQATDVPDH